MVNLDKVLERHDIDLDYVIQIGVDYETPFEEAFIYDAHGARRVVYFDLLPNKVIHTRENLLERKRQKANLAAITSVHKQPLRIFVDHLSFYLESKSLDVAIIEQKINPLDITLLNINVDGRIDEILKAAEMLFNLGLEYLIVKNKYYYDDIVKYGFIKIDEGLYYNGINPL